jgi:hypothetical protein
VSLPDVLHHLQVLTSATRYKNATVSPTNRDRNCLNSLLVLGLEMNVGVARRVYTYLIVNEI